MKSARPPKGKTSAAGHGKFKPLTRFSGTDNPRHLRILAALLTRARTREEIDGIAGASNGPDAISTIRSLGLPKETCLLCERTPCIDRDGQEVQRGIYWLSPLGRRRVKGWMHRRAREKGCR